jgi:hypothetical protein
MEVAYRRRRRRRRQNWSPVQGTGDRKKHRDGMSNLPFCCDTPTEVMILKQVIMIFFGNYSFL